MTIKIKLPIAFKNAWTTALRSGNFDQCQSYLKTSYGYCCLGVAVEVAGTGFRSDPDPGYVEEFDVFPTRSGSAGLLSYQDVPKGVFDALRQHINIVGYNIEVQNHLSKLNDDNNATFTEIANWIDENL